MTRMASTMTANDVFLIFPEGQNWTPGRRAGIIRRLRERGDHARARRAEELRNVCRLAREAPGRPARPGPRPTSWCSPTPASPGSRPRGCVGRPAVRRPPLPRQDLDVCRGHRAPRTRCLRCVARRAVERGRRLGRGERRVLAVRERTRADGPEASGTTSHDHRLPPPRPPLRRGRSDEPHHHVPRRRGGRGARRRGSRRGEFAGSAGDGSTTGSVPVTGIDGCPGGGSRSTTARLPRRSQGTVRPGLPGRAGVRRDRLQLRARPGGRGGQPARRREPVSTRMACEPALMEQEQWITEMLSSRPRLELSGPYSRCTGARARVVARARAERGRHRRPEASGAGRLSERPERMPSSQERAAVKSVVARQRRDAGPLPVGARVGAEEAHLGADPAQPHQRLADPLVEHVALEVDREAVATPSTPRSAATRAGSC